MTTVTKRVFLGWFPPCS